MKKYTYSKSKILLERSQKVLAGGVSSEFRKKNYPHAIFYEQGKGSRIKDVDGNEYIDFTLSQGPLILGHSNTDVLHQINEYSRNGQLFAGQHIKEIELAEKLQKLIPSAELIRFCLDGSSAVQTALRVARAKTGRQKFLRFEGHYHGWLDNMCWGISAPSPEELGPREDPKRHPWSEGLPLESRNEFLLLPWNDLTLVRDIVASNYEQLAAIITEPVMCNNGCILPRDGFLQGLRKICDEYGIALIFDEVITGFRVSLSGAQQYFGVIPDLSIFAKAMGSGYPISALVGRREWMKVIEEGRVIHAGTMNTSNPTVAAALSTIEVLERDLPYDRMYQLGNQLMTGLKKAAADARQNLLVQGLGPMFHTGFTDLKEVKDYRDTLQYDRDKLAKFVAGMHDNGIRIIGRGLWYISASHKETDIVNAIEVANKVLAEL